MSTRRRLLVCLAVVAGVAAIGLGVAVQAGQNGPPSSTPGIVFPPSGPAIGTPALLGLPEPTAHEVAAQLALAQPPPPPVISPGALAAAATTEDKARKGERLDKVRKLDSGEFLTPAPETIKAKRSGDDAEKVTKSPKMGGSPKDNSDKKQFALYTGGGTPINPDGSTGPKKFVNLPVWVVTYENVPVAERRAPGFADYGDPGGTADTTLLIIIDDATGDVVFSLQFTAGALDGTP